MTYNYSQLCFCPNYLDSNMTKIYIPRWRKSPSIEANSEWKNCIKFNNNKSNPRRNTRVA